METRGLYALLASCSLLLGLGIFLPCMAIEPGYAEFTALVSILKPEFGQEKQISIWGGILALWQDGAYFLAVIIFAFSVMFPIGKLGALWQALDRITIGQPPAESLRQVEKLGKFSMLDVFVLALIIIAIKGLPGGTSVRLQWGLVAFIVAIVLSLLLPGWINRCAGDKRY